jgi:hypothetical protein
VTDLRFYEDDHRTIRRAEVNAVADQLRKKEQVILSLGVARAWQKPGDTMDRHWLQVNGIHRVRQVLWRMRQPVL